MANTTLPKKILDSFQNFKSNRFDNFRIRLRRERIKQLRVILSDPGSIDVEKFNYEVWWFENDTFLDGVKVKYAILDPGEVPDDLLAKMESALGTNRLELHGNYIWGSGSRVFAPSIKDPAKKLNSLRESIKILNKPDLSPMSKAKTLQTLPGFGPNIATGLVMVFHPNEFAIYNKQSIQGLNMLGGDTKSLEAFQKDILHLKESIRADDFIELDWFLYLVANRRIPIEDKKETIHLSEILKTLRLEHCLTERLEVRRQAEKDAKSLLEMKGGSFNEVMLKEFFNIVNLDFWNNNKIQTRWGVAFRGANGKHLVSQVEKVNNWMMRLWRAPDDQVMNILDEYFSERPISHAGSTLPTLILYLKDPQKYNVMVGTMAKGLGRLVSYRFGGNTAEAYKDYNQEVIKFRETYGLVPQELDIILCLDESLWGIPPGGEKLPDPKVSYTLDDLIAETGFTADQINGWLRRLKRKKHIIFQGPPGTGKTFVAKKLAKLFSTVRGGRVSTVQFHPSYSYEDFMQGLRPKSTDAGITFEIVEGRFMQFCREARKLPNDIPCVLILDEINRANLSRVFGELMYLMEYREQEVPLATGGQPFSIPGNVYIIGTMNTADRSIALIDHALRRRFSFIRLVPEYDVLKNYLERHGLPAESLVSLLLGLNQAIDDHNYEVGISFFMQDDENLMDSLSEIWEGEIEPYLEEYFYDSPGKVDPFKWENLINTKLSDWAQ